MKDDIVYIKDYYKNRVKYNHEICLITDYDKDVINNSVFISIKDNKYIDEAINNGAKTIIYNNTIKQSFTKTEGVNYIGVEFPKKELSKLFQYFYSTIDKKPIVIGITGTNGKTTTSYLLYQYLKWLKNDVLYIGTSWIYSYNSLIEKTESINNTTPSISYLIKYLWFNSYDYVILEISSQGIEEGRILGIKFDIISITNLATDHLDYHSSINEYKIVKGKLLHQISDNSIYKKIILNKDDLQYNYYSSITLHDIISYGINQGDIKLVNYKSDLSGIELVINDKYLTKLSSNLIGDFNIYNILNLYSISKVLKYNVNYIKAFLKLNTSIPGRMNIVKKENNTFIIDYAHTIDSVTNVLNFVKKISDNKKIVVVIGCGGNRDKTKRSIIGKLVTNKADYVYFTEDNSRNEEPEKIILDMITEVKTNNYEIIFSRKEAIKEAYNKFNNSIILVLGKGIENYILKNSYKEEHNDLRFIEGIA